VIGDRYRTRSRNARVADAIAFRRDIRSGDQGADSDLAIDMDKALRDLSDVDREVLTLVVLDGLTPQEVSKVVGSSGPAVRMRLMRARRALRSHPRLQGYLVSKVRIDERA
jgi:RNA polymerase sigma-70 factor, ECF subfamily